MKNHLLFLFFVCISRGILAQNNPAPEYLLNNIFPDSVLSLNLVNRRGEEIKLAEVIKECSGSVVILDVWASWCPDCIQGLPALDDLRAQTKGKKVIYLFLSVDKEDVKWQGAIDKFEIVGLHYRIPAGWKNPFSNYVSLDWIPRYVMLDESGRVTVPKAIKADDAVLKNRLLRKGGD